MANDVNIKVNLDTKDVSKGTKNATKSIKSLDVALGDVAKTAGLAFAAFGGLIGGTLIQAGKLEKIQTKFEVLTGSVASAQKVMKDLTDFTAKTPFQIEGVTGTAAQLISFGVAADDILPTLQGIGDVAAAVGAPLQDLGLIFGQVRAAGKLTGERLLQLQERAVPIGAALAKTLGVAESAVKDLVSSGKVDFKTFEKAFQSLSKEGGIAFEGMVKQSKTLGGVMSTLGDNFSLLAADIGKQFLPVAKRIALAITDIIQVARDNPELVKFAAGFIAIGAAVAGSIAAVATLGLALPALGAGLATAAVAFPGIASGLAAISLPMVLTAAAVVALGVGFVKFHEEIGIIIGGIASIIIDGFSGIAKIIAGVFNPKLAKEGAEQLGRAVVAATGGIGDQIAELHKKQEQEERDRKLAAHEQELSDNKAQAELLASQEQEREENKKQEADAARQLALEEEISFLEERNTLLAEIDFAANEATIAANQEKIKNNLSMLTGESNSILKLKANQAKKERKMEEEKAKFEEDQRKAKIDAVSGSLKNISSLTRTNNKTLFEIGKRSAQAAAVVDGFAAVQKALAAAPPPFNFILAATVGVATAVQIAGIEGQTLSAQDGGRVPSIVPGLGDRQPALLEKDETIVPRETFPELIEAFGGSVDGEGEGGRNQSVMIGFDGDEAERVLTARQTEATALGISEAG